VEKVVRIFKSFEEADRADREYRMSLTPDERVSIAVTLMGQSRIFYDDPPERLERVCRAIPLSEH
jgi:hypothetical protein